MAVRAVAEESDQYIRILQRTIEQARDEVRRLSRGGQQDDALKLLHAVNVAEGKLHYKAALLPYEEAVQLIRQATITLRYAITHVEELTESESLRAEPTPTVVPLPSPVAEATETTEWISQREAAALAGVSESMVYLWIKEGRVRKRKEGHKALIARADIEQMQGRRRQHGTAKGFRKQQMDAAVSPAPVAVATEAPATLAMVAPAPAPLPVAATVVVMATAEKGQRWTAVFAEADWWHDTKTRGWMA